MRKYPVEDHILSIDFFGQYTTALVHDPGRRYQYRLFPSPSLVQEIVPFYDEKFYDHYTSVGSFPGVALSLREIEISLLKSFTGLVKPII